MKKEESFPSTIFYEKFLERERQTDRKTERHRQADRQTDRHRQADRQTDRQTER